MRALQNPHLAIRPHLRTDCRPTEGNSTERLVKMLLQIAACLFRIIRMQSAQLAFQTAVPLQSFSRWGCRAHARFHKGTANSDCRGDTIKGQFQIDGPHEKLGFRCSAEQEEEPSCLYVLDGRDPVQKDRVGCGLLHQFVHNEYFVSPWSSQDLHTLQCHWQRWVSSPDGCVGSTSLAVTCNVAHASGSSPPLFQTFILPK